MESALDMVSENIGIGEAVMDAVRLVISSAMTISENPDASFEDVLSQFYPETSLAEVRGWWGWDK
ncbi:protein of unknown function [Streptantibioticus cattleyicolor NRRL 8057 = DSM 46488]|nr:protein of unknown function [Streptantibioticus cattleyicolor NRRL 8057 = DSM 46488]